MNDRHRDLFNYQKGSKYKVLVIYYSLDGNTKFIAENLASELNADLYRIKPVSDVSQKGLLKIIEGSRQVLKHRKPILEPVKVDFSCYDLIYVGTPMWAFNVAPAIKSLLLDKIRDKDVALFYTYEGFEYNFRLNVEKLINSNNRFISARGFKNVKERQYACIEESCSWAHFVAV